MNISKIIKASGNQISFVSLQAAVGLQMLRPLEADPGAGTTFLADHNVAILVLCVIGLVLLTLIEHWHRDDHKEANRTIHHTENSVTESQSLKGYDGKTIREIFRDNGSRDEG